MDKFYFNGIGGYDSSCGITRYTRIIFSFCPTQMNTRGLP